MKKTTEQGRDDSRGNGASGLARNVALWLAIFGVCTLFLLINFATIWYGLRAGFFPNAHPMRWGTLLLEQLIVWYPVALLAPACLWLAARFQLERERRLPTLATEEIDWIEAEGYYARLHVGGKSHLLRETLTNLESRLDQNRFLRIHPSTIVNLERIRELQTQSHGECTVVLNDGTQLKLSRGCRDRLTTLLGQQF